jgi:hypothetical protein
VSDESLNLLLTAGQIGALVFAVLAALAGGISGLAGKELSRRADTKLAELHSRVARLLAANGILLRALKSFPSARNSTR